MLKCCKNFKALWQQKIIKQVFLIFFLSKSVNFTLVIWQFCRVLFSFECSSLIRLHFRAVPLYQKHRCKIACDMFDNSVIFFPLNHRITLKKQNSWGKKKVVLLMTLEQLHYEDVKKLESSVCQHWHIFSRDIYHLKENVGYDRIVLFFISVKNISFLTETSRWVFLFVCFLEVFLVGWFGFLWQVGREKKRL